MAFVIQIIQFLAGLSIIVGIHELGHLFFAKLFKMRVNSYIIGFPPKIFKMKYGETEYAIGSIPLGGAVQIAGMIDESLDCTHLSSQPQPWEFRSKAAWQRLIVILGGIIFNLTSGMLIYIGLTYIIGHNYLPKDAVNKYGIMPNSIGRQMGFKAGDKIIKINGKDFEAFHDIYAPSLFLHAKGYYTIYRDGSVLDIPISAAIITPLLEQGPSDLLRPIYPCIIASVIPNSSISLAGLIAGDQIIELAAQPICDQEEWLQATDAYLDKTVAIAYMRNNTKMTTTLTIDAQSKHLDIFAQLAYQKRTYSLLQSIPIGLQKTMAMIAHQLLGIWKLITGKLSIKKSLGGPISIARMFNHTFIWSSFLSLIAYLSIVIGLTNGLPLPVLDGGHALFILYEMLFGRKVSDKVVQITQQLGMILLLLTMLYVCSNDIRKLFT